MTLLALREMPEPRAREKLIHAVGAITEALALIGPSEAGAAPLQQALSSLESVLAGPLASRANRRLRSGGVPRPRGLPEGLLLQIDAYLIRCLERESPPRVSELARFLGLTLGPFVETFHSHAGVTPSSYLKGYQIDAAALLLRKTDLAVGKVGYAAGFGTRRTFFREFRQRMGTSPAQYRNRTKCL